MATSRQIVDFAQEHGLVIHPAVGYTYYVKNYLEAGRCPCDADRPTCPCPESIEETRELGSCKCKLLWRDYQTFKESHLKEG